MAFSPMEGRRRRIWFLSPAMATAIFFAVQVVLSAFGSQPTAGVAGLAPRTPQAPRGDRVARPIEPADPVIRAVPEDGDALLRLLENHSRVQFRESADPR